MTLLELLRLTKNKGIKLYLDNGQLAFKGPSGSMTQALKTQIVALKPQIIALLEQTSASSAPAITVTERNEGDRTLLSYAQQRMWLLDQIEGGSANYNVPASFRLTGHLDLNALQRAFKSVVERHQSLRTCFVEQSPGNPLQEIQSAEGFNVKFDDLSMLNDADKESEVLTRVAAEAVKLFDLSKDYMLRVSVLRLAPQEHIVMTTMHHIASDGWSLGVLINEFCSLYSAYVDGQDNPLEPLPLQYADYAHWQRNWLKGEVLDKQLAYWENQLADLPVVHSLPLDKPRPQIQTYNGDTFDSWLGPELSEQLNKFSKENGVTLFMSLHAALSVLLSRYSNETDIVVGSPVANREQEGVGKLIGLFINTLVLRSNLSDSPTFKTLLKQSQGTLLDAYAHQQVPFEQVVEKLQPKRSLSHNPLFQVWLVLQNNDEGELDVPDISLQPMQRADSPAKFDLALNIDETASGLKIGWAYNTDLFKRQTIERMASHFRNLVASAIASPDDNVFSLPMLDDADMSAQAAWNATQTQYDDAVTVHQLFEQQVQCYPSHRAVEFNGHILSYDELNAKANRLARLLIDSGVEPADHVGIYLERSSDLLIAVLAVIKAGAAYVPLEPSYPSSRIQTIIEDANINVALLNSEQMETFPMSGVDVLLMDNAATDEQWMEEYESDNLSADEVAVSAQSLAYILYTSGSTGKPKGVMVPHRGVVNYLSHAKANYLGEHIQGAVVSSPLAFDATLTSLLTPLMGGKTVKLLPSGDEDLEYLARQLGEDESWLFKVTPAHLEALSHLLPKSGNHNASHCIVVGGDQLNQSLLTQFAKVLLPNSTFINEYGPTETVVGCSTYTVSTQYNEIDDLNLDVSGAVPIGRPICNTRLYVLSQNMEPQPLNTIGELYIGGDGVTLGYLNKDEQTQYSFVQHPSLKSEKLYRTGDLVRLRDDGELVFVGRVDHQVKIRGFRIELGEVESAIRAIEGVRDALVIAKDDGNEHALSAYVTPYEQTLSEIDKANLAADYLKILRQKLPSYMVPSHCIIVENMPLTSNGKIDRRALAKLEQTAQQQLNYTAPKNQQQAQLCQIWQDVLGIEQIGITDNFFELGGHSLMAIRLVARINEQFDSNFNLKSLFSFPTIEQLESQLKESEGAIKQPPICRVARSEEIPTSYAQQRLWMLEQIDGGSSHYHISAALKLSGKLNKTALERAFTTIVDRHESLRTCFAQGSGDFPVQIIHSSDAFNIDYVDLSTAKESNDGTQLRTWVEAQSTKHFDLQADLMLRVGVAQIAAEQHVVVVTMHHIASDGWSLNILVKELCALYDAYTNDTPLNLAPIDIQYADYAYWQRSWLTGDELDQQLDYWCQQLADLPVVHSLPLDKPRPAVQSFNGEKLHTHIGPGLTQALNEFCQANGATLFMGLHAAMSTLLAQHSNASDIVMGTVVANREQQEIAPLIGFFVNTLVLRSDLSSNPQFDQLLTQSKRTLLDAYAHQQVPFEQVVERLQPSRSLSHSPLFQVMLALQNNEKSELTLHDMDVSLIEPSELCAKYDLTINITQNENGLVIGWEFNSDLFNTDTIAAMAERFNILLEDLLLNPQAPVFDAQVLTLSEQKQQIIQWNDTCSVAKMQASIHGQFEKVASQRPHKIALTCDDEQLTYQALNERANALAHYLTAYCKVTKEEPVGVCLERSIEAIVSLLAILKAGGTYVPLSPSLPEERARFIVEDAGVKTIISVSGNHINGLHSDMQWLFLDTDLIQTRLRDCDHSNLNQAFECASHMAYINYTSGSTGKPKGVMVEHSNVISLVDNPNFVSLSEQTVMLHGATLSFDAVTFEIWGALLNGGQVAIQSKPHIEMEELGEFLLKNNVNTAFLTTALFDVFTAIYQKPLPNLQYLMVGGDIVNKQSFKRMKELNPTIALSNIYGPTENTTFSTSYLLPKNFYEYEGLPIGKPLQNRVAFVLSPNMTLLPAGTVGELYVGGAGVARGYLNRTDLTEQMYVDNPFYDPAALNSSKKLYKTGDLVYQQKDGNIVFVGRRDHQVKIRGFRIELGEIEHAIAEHEDVCDTTLLVAGDGADKQLIAYVVASSELRELLTDSDSQQRQTAKICQTLQQSLPDYMIPSAFVYLDAFPLTENGKIDRKALPKADFASQAAAYVAPHSETQRILCDIWQEVLTLEQVGIEDNFFELGGHSLLVMKVRSKAEQKGLSMTARMLFSSPILRDLAAQIDNQTEQLPRQFKVPENLIPQQCSYITPEMLPLTELTQMQIQSIANSVDGGYENIQDIYPLAPLQQGILYHHISAQDNDPYVLTSLFTVESDAQLEHFIQALQFIIDRHDVLRTAIYWQGLPEPHQVVQREAVLPVNWPQLAADKDVFEQIQQLNQVGKLKLDLSKAPLIQLDVAHDQVNQHYVVALKYHHIIADHVGLEIIEKEISAFQNANTQSLEQPLPYREFIAQVLNQAKEYDAEAFFCAKLADVTESSLPFNLLDVMGDGSNMAELKAAVPSHLENQIRRLSKDLHISPAVVFHAAWALVISACCAKNDVVFGTVLSGRLSGSERLENVLGMFINTLPIRANTQGKSVLEFVMSIRDELQELIPYEQASLSLAQQCSGLSHGRNLFSAVLNYRHSVANSDSEAATQGTDNGVRLLSSKERTNYPFSLSVDDMKQGFNLDFQVDKSVNIERVMDYMIHALQAMSDCLQHRPNELISEVMVAQPDLPQLMAWSLGQVHEVDNRCVHEKFQDVVKSNPKGVALIFEDQEITYDQLNQRANRLANYLRRYSLVGPDRLVGVYCERSIEMFVSILAVLKAGGAYLPLDPSSPNARIKYVLEDASVTLVLTQRHLVQDINESRITHLILDDEQLNDDLEQYDELNIECSTIGVNTDSLAYVIYTSGSTGKPKGCELIHKGLVNLGFAQQQAFEITAHSKVLQFASIAFDAATWEWCMALTNGASLVIPNKDQAKSAESLTQLVEKNEVTHATLPPVLLPQLCQGSWVSVSTLIVAGEACSIAMAELWSPNRRFVNAYGPSETTVCATYGCYSPGQSVLHIGKPLPNVSTFIMNNEQLAPIGVPGELLVGGVNLARGYLGREDLTKEKFVANPFYNPDDASSSKLLYRTGDLVRWGADGNIEFLGRIDHQVKINGYRIELGEVEHTLSKFESVSQVSVIPFDKGEGNKSLVAYIVPSQPSIDVQDSVEQRSFISALRTQLSEQLPEYMHPSAFVLLDTLPMNNNGKVDRNKLPHPDVALQRAEYVAPANPLEEALCSIWQNVLGIAQVGCKDDFFELGGNSLKVIQVISEAKAKGIQLTVGQIWNNPTIKGLADDINKERVSQSLTVSEAKHIQAGNSLIAVVYLDSLLDESYLRHVLHSFFADEKLAYELKYTADGVEKLGIKRSRRHTNALWLWQDETVISQSLVQMHKAQLSEKTSSPESTPLAATLLNGNTQQVCILAANELLIEQSCWEALVEAFKSKLLKLHQSA
ncbi:amino acid adenylation domain-containing protein [Pseudoalteromonas sp. JBTF-M23]|uniref:Amino acid adenylation domain-containing protein n=1 Tax=Pseudoalteromonas caenipelagi TaxID=2726988 RepID=A0A849VI17_9GAMM|nr:non-ribosomal peptide synthetase [Pseudoalteromonas caenipelagi]NOU51317.1 amino acid adenylation domain-containing protein [Pseudoalteromonas caenipelagi]